MREEIIRRLHSFMLAKQAWLEEQGTEVRYWTEEDKELLQQLLPTDEDAKECMLRMHAAIISGTTGPFLSAACPFCVRKNATGSDCDTCLYGRRKGICKDERSAWFMVFSDLSDKDLWDAINESDLVLKLWKQSGCYALAESLCK